MGPRRRNGAERLAPPPTVRDGGGPGRAGYTLVELLTVVLVIAILVSIGIYVLAAWTGQARAAATSATIRKLQAQLGQRSEAFNRLELETLMKLSDPIPGLTPTKSLMQLANGNTERARVLRRKVLYRALMPQTWAEASYLLGQLGQTAPAVINPQTESAEVLYLIVTEGGVVGYTPTAADQFGKTEYADTDGNGRQEFVDAWGNPLRFYRWPTRLVRPGGYGSAITAAQFEFARSHYGDSLTSTTEAGRDPEDPLNWLDPAITGWNPQNLGSPGSAGSIASNATYAESVLHTVGTYHAFLIVSAGPDGMTGLFEPSDLSSLGRLAAPDSGAATFAYDNVTNHNQRAGGN